MNVEGHPLIVKIEEKDAKKDIELMDMTKLGKTILKMKYSGIQSTKRFRKNIISSEKCERPNL
jgi:hypothetical protein